MMLFEQPDELRRSRWIDPLLGTVVFQSDRKELALAHAGSVLSIVDVLLLEETAYAVDGIRVSIDDGALGLVRRLLGSPLGWLHGSILSCRV
jgi:hypothetical protein